MGGNPELPAYMRNMEIKHALSQVSDRKASKSLDIDSVDVKSRPNEER